MSSDIIEIPELGLSLMRHINDFRRIYEKSLWEAICEVAEVEFDESKEYQLLPSVQYEGSWSLLVNKVIISSFYADNSTMNDNLAKIGALIGYESDSIIFILKLMLPNVELDNRVFNMENGVLMNTNGKSN